MIDSITENVLGDLFTEVPFAGLLQYMVIFIVLTALSPYGIYFIRMLSYLFFGTSKPYFIKKKRGAKQPKSYFKPDSRSHLEKTAIDQIERLAEQIEKLQRRLSEEREGRQFLENENEALKTHIRSFSEDATKGEAAREDDLEAGSSLNDFALFGLKEGRDTAWKDVKAAFRNAARTHHPDQSGDSEMFKTLNAAYARLKIVYGKK